VRDIKRRKYTIGFTLIELLVVIAIIAILAAIVAPNAFRAIEKAKVAKCVRDIKSIQSAAMAYYTDTGRFPPNDDTYTAGSAVGHLSGIDFLQNQAGVAGWDGPYLEKWPAFPWTIAGLVADYQWQGEWSSGQRADCDGNGVNDEFIELNFQSAVDQQLIRAKGLEIDRAIDDGNLDTGNFGWGGSSQFQNRCLPHQASHCLYYVAAYR